MTTIAFRDGVMAADTRAYSGNRAPIGTKSKVHRLDDGTLIGVSSTIPGGGETVIQWWREKLNSEIALPAAFSMLAVNQAGEVFYANDTPNVSGPLTGDFFSIGSGSDFAIGAMEVGADAVSAVITAAKHDVWSDVPVDALSLSGKSWRVAQ